jgi:hypothetical protein
MGSKKRKPLLRQLINILLATIILTVGYICFTIVYDLHVRMVNRSRIQDIATLNEDYAARFTHFIEDVEQETSWKVEIISGLRTREEQIQLKRENPRNAPVNKSRHLLGRAVDLNLYRRSGLQMVVLKKSSSNASWLATRVPEIARRYGLFWGGNYRNYHDPVHFEIN